MSESEEHGRESPANEELLIAESYEGVVRHVGNDNVVVIYERGGELIEQVYEGAQFRDSKLPEEGTRLRAYVKVVRLSKEEEDSPDTDSEETIRHRVNRRNVLRGFYLTSRT